MRARYSAFALGDLTYLLSSWHPSTRPAALELDPARSWVRLEILDATDGGPFADTGEVEFRAHHRTGAVRGVQHERSRFARRRGRWYYLDGVTAS